MLRYGIISDIQEATGRARVHWNDDDIVSDWLPVLVPKALEDSFSWFPDINEHVACLVDETSDTGVILGAIYSEATRPNAPDRDKFRVRFKDGTVLEYDRKAGKLLADVKGDVEVLATGSVGVKASGAVDVETPTNATVKATLVTLDAPNVVVTGILSVAQLAIAAGIGGNGNAAISGNLVVEGAIESEGDITSGGEITNGGNVALGTHKHIGVAPGVGTSGTPIP